jgi:hypothetical protein
MLVNPYYLSLMEKDGLFARIQAIPDIRNWMTLNQWQIHFARIFSPLFQALYTAILTGLFCWYQTSAPCIADTA